jgi:hypothetical protein
MNSKQINQSSNQSEKARIGAIGEYNVVSMLMQNGWDAFNANCSIKNFKSIDIVCIRKIEYESSELPVELKTTFIQVKTCKQNNIPIGLTIRQCLNKDYLLKNVVGPYVFVSVKKEYDQDKDKEYYSFRYFILSRRQFIELAYASHQHYVFGYKRDKELNLDSPAGIKVKWLEGKGEEETINRIAFENPLSGCKCEDIWDNIWEE